MYKYDVTLREFSSSKECNIQIYYWYSMWKFVIALRTAFWDYYIRTIWDWKTFQNVVLYNWHRGRKDHCKCWCCTCYLLNRINVSKKSICTCSNYLSGQIIIRYLLAAQCLMWPNRLCHWQGANNLICFLCITFPSATCSVNTEFYCWP